MQEAWDLGGSGDYEANYAGDARGRNGTTPGFLAVT